MGFDGAPTCSSVTTTTDYKVQLSVATGTLTTTATTSSFSVTVKQGPFVKSAAVADATCAFYDSGYTTVASTATATSFTPATIAHVLALTVKTTSADAAKQCTSDATKT